MMTHMGTHNVSIVDMLDVVGVEGRARASNARRCRATLKSYCHHIVIGSGFIFKWPPENASYFPQHLRQQIDFIFI